jgi:hypothetical protein
LWREGCGGWCGGRGAGEGGRRRRRDSHPAALSAAAATATTVPLFSNTAAHHQRGGPRGRLLTILWFCLSGEHAPLCPAITTAFRPFSNGECRSSKLRRCPTAVYPPPPCSASSSSSSSSAAAADHQSSLTRCFSFKWAVTHGARISCAGHDLPSAVEPLSPSSPPCTRAHHDRFCIVFLPQLLLLLVHSRRQPACNQQPRRRRPSCPRLSRRRSQHPPPACSSALRQRSLTSSRSKCKLFLCIWDVLREACRSSRRPVRAIIPLLSTHAAAPPPPPLQAELRLCTVPLASLACQRVFKRLCCQCVVVPNSPNCALWRCCRCVAACHWQRACVHTHPLSLVGRQVLEAAAPRAFAHHSAAAGRAKFSPCWPQAVRPPAPAFEPFSRKFSRQFYFAPPSVALRSVEQQRHRLPCFRCQASRD